MKKQDYTVVVGSVDGSDRVYLVSAKDAFDACEFATKVFNAHESVRGSAKFCMAGAVTFTATIREFPNYVPEPIDLRVFS